MNPDSEEITKLLERGAWEELLPLLYDELRRIAHQSLARERHDHTLQATGLVHEAYLRLMGQGYNDWENRAQFLAACAITFRRILVDYARRRSARKRMNVNGHRRVQLADVSISGDLAPIDVLALEDALQRLAEAEPEHGRVIELRFYGGLTIEQTAQCLDLSIPTVVRYWRFAKAWLYNQLQDEEQRDDA